MKVLILGGGGREHALVRAMSRSSLVESVYCSPGNAGTAREPGAQNVALDSIEQARDFALREKIDLTLPGSEDWLVSGVADVFRDAGLRVFGPPAASARLEGSKGFAKDFMARHGVGTARYSRQHSYLGALRALEDFSPPIVVKADGLAAGKGVLICDTLDAARMALESTMVARVFGNAGDEVVLEEFLPGPEASILALCDGRRIVPMISAKDHKRIGDGDTGPNTGGMGVVAPNPSMGETEWDDFRNSILEPTARGLAAENLHYSGVMFFGLKLTPDGVRLLEYNVRFGDPELQAVLALLETDLARAVLMAMDGELVDPLAWSDGSACCVVMASGGYPGKYSTGFPIHGADGSTGTRREGVGPADKHAAVEVYLAGASIGPDGEAITSGGRVLNLVATGTDLAAARAKVYAATHEVGFEGAIWRSDIGR